MPLASTAHLADRLARMRASLAESGADALIVTHLPNVFYLTNFSATAAIALVRRESVDLITDFRYRTAAEMLLASTCAPPHARLVPAVHSSDEALRELIETLPDRRIGFEAAHLSVKRHDWLLSSIDAARPPADDRLGERAVLVPTSGIVERARTIKDDHEIQTLRTAAAMLSHVAIAAIDCVRPGRSEREIAGEVDWLLRREGFDRPAFETIVASGPNSALPHARPGPRMLTSGDLVVLDFGGVYDGYCVDLTRTVCIGPPSAEARRLHHAVRAAHEAALAAAAADRAIYDVDEAARARLRDDGLADAFGHGTGHGLGLEVHEAPRITWRRHDASRDDILLEWLAPGMVFTIEPGVYLPAIGGVRIEDDVLITDEGKAELLTDVPRELVVR